MRAMEEEPFGPLALVSAYDEPDEMIAEANRLPYGLAAYAWTGSAAMADRVAAEVRSGMVTINHLGLALPETPFGGTGDSGYGSEGGTEAMDAYLETKFVTRRA
jgi:acyl-CoA reductase-like NAD-dependent aldehyde dehydrogenase